MKPAVVTIKELSCLSGYSISTVSKALNNKKDISIETRVAIRNIAKQHNYVPNNYAVSLRNKTSKSIAIIIPNVTESCYNQALCCLQKMAEAQNYRVLLNQSFGCDLKEKKIIKSLNDGSVHGALIVLKGSNKRSYSSYTLPVQMLNIESYNAFEAINKLSEQSLTRRLKV